MVILKLFVDGVMAARLPLEQKIEVRVLIHKQNKYTTYIA